MDKLLQPDTGLMIWTVVTFVLLVLVLTKAAWKPILDGVNSREARIREDIERAEKANAELHIVPGRSGHHRGVDRRTSVVNEDRSH